MEFVIVRFDEQRRRVFIDNQKQGLTGKRQNVPEGLHLFDLGEPLDYAPDSQEVEVTGTSAQEPMIIEFAPLAPALASAPPAPVAARLGPPATRARRSTKRAPAQKTAKRSKPPKPSKPPKRVPPGARGSAKAKTGAARRSTTTARVAGTASRSKSTRPSGRKRER